MPGDIMSRKQGNFLCGISNYLIFEGRIMSEDFKKVKSFLEQIPLSPGDEFLMHSSLDSLGGPSTWASEIINYLRERSYKKSILKRKNDYYCFKGNLSLLKNTRDFKKVLTKYGLKIIEVKIPKDITELKGYTAYQGKAKGKVKIIYLPEKSKNFQKGEILVSPMTEPDFVPIIKKASAIITDEGGITCHAAIVSRELKIPCVVGTKIATKAFKDGDKVEVDATKGLVRKIK